MTIKPSLAIDLVTPRDVVLPCSNPWLAEFMGRDEPARFASMVSDYLPGVPLDIDANDYADARRRGVVTPYAGDAAVRDACLNLLATAESMHANGVLCGPEWQRNDAKESWHIGPPHWYGPVTFGIDNEGLLVHHDGKHRAALAWCLGLDLPVRIVAHYSKWHAVVEKLQSSILYDECPHPSLIGKPTVRTGSGERFRRVADFLLERGVATVLDVGSNTGHWPVVAASRGFGISMVEIDPAYRSVARSWLRAGGWPVCFMESLKPGIADAVTMFSSLQHVARTPQSLTDVVESLKQQPVLVLEVPVPGERIWSITEPEPWRWVDDQLRDAGYQRRVLFVDARHLSRRTIGYWKSEST